jgi:uncharacterized protein YjlB
MVQLPNVKDVKPVAYQLRPTNLTPNSDYPLLHYRGVVDLDQLTASKASKVFEENGWETQWLVRYAKTQRAHYHSKTHETMVVLNGNAKIRFGSADLTSGQDPEEEHEDEGVEVDAAAGDVFVIPAGVSHKTFNATPEYPFEWLTGNDGRGIGNTDIDQIDVSGFIMLGAYPRGGAEWDFCVGGEGKIEPPVPSKDPVLGESPNGLLGIWK